MFGGNSRLKLVVQVLNIGLYGRGNVAFRNIFSMGGVKLNILIFMIYGL